MIVQLAGLQASLRLRPCAAWPGRHFFRRRRDGARYAVRQRRHQLHDPLSRRSRRTRRRPAHAAAADGATGATQPWSAGFSHRRTSTPPAVWGTKARWMRPRRQRGRPSGRCGRYGGGAHRLLRLQRYSRRAAIHHRLRSPLLAALEPIMPSGGTPLGESAGFAAIQIHGRQRLLHGPGS